MEAGITDHLWMVEDIVSLAGPKAVIADRAA
jgi:hypothetical protein